MNNDPKGPLFWIPRILAILLILFIAMFSLDVFEMGGGIGQILLGLLMHNLWTIILIVLLILGWRRDSIGAIGFLTFGLVFLGIRLASGILTAPTQGTAANIAGLIMLSGFPLLIGLLFLLRWKFRK